MKLEQNLKNLISGKSVITVKKCYGEQNLDNE